MRRIVLENPVTHQKIELVEARPSNYRDAKGVQKWFLMKFGATLGPSLYNALGKPTEALGRGSFSVALQCRRHRDRAIKVSFDGMDGNMAAAVQAQQLAGVGKGGKLRGLVEIHGVWRLRDYQDFMRVEEVERLDNSVPWPLPKDLWIIFAEKVLPLAEAANHNSPRTARNAHHAIADAFRTEMKGAQEWVIDLIRKAGQRPLASMRDWSQVVGGGARQMMIGAMRDYRGELIEVVASAQRAGDAELAELMTFAANTLEELINLKMPIVDLHPGNWGYRLGRNELVILDFGLSSLPSSAPAVLTEIDLERKERKIPERPRVKKEHKGQMVMFNPKLPRRGWWVSPKGKIFETPADGHVDYLISHLASFGFTPAEIADEEAGAEWCLEVAMRRGAIRLMGVPGQWGAEVYRLTPTAHRRIFAALDEVGARPGDVVYVLDWSKNKEVKTSVPDIRHNPLDEVEKMWRTENYKAARRDPAKGEVLGRLLQIAPESVVVRLGEALPEDIAGLHAKGRYYSAKGSRVVKMEAIQCHSNSSRLYLEDPKNTTIVTGYALSLRDNLWREHTWALRGGRVIETTMRRRAYFGYPLTSKQARTFADKNW